MQIHLVIGHNAPSASGANPTALYLGTCADVAGKRISEALATGRFPVVEQCTVVPGVKRYADDDAIAAFAKLPPQKSELETALEAGHELNEQLAKLQETIAQLETDVLAAKHGRDNMEKEAEKWQGEFNRLRGEMVQTGNAAQATIEELRAELIRTAEEKRLIDESSERVIKELRAELDKLKAPTTKANEANALDAVAPEGGKPDDKPVEKSGNAKGQKAQK